MTGRATVIADFLGRHGWGTAARQPLAGDASFRRYERLDRGGEVVVLMDAPPPEEDVRPFLAVARHLSGWGYSAPRVLAADEEAGLVLLEDLGDDLYVRVLEGGGDETLLYGAAIDLLLDLHRRPPPGDLPPYDEAKLLAEAGLLVEWYLPALTGAETPAEGKQDYDDLWRAAFAAMPTLPPVLVMRDYHAENLLWLPRRSGVARVGLLDFQDALIGSPAYDLVSLLEDARRDVAPNLAAAMKARYAAGSNLDAADLDVAYAVLGAQRNAKIIGIFTRLWKRDGKARYLGFLPRMWRLLEGDLRHPALNDIRDWFDRHIPEASRRTDLQGVNRQ
jgi:hypothetical protein